MMLVKRQPIPKGRSALRDGGIAGSFIVTAKGGFSIKGRHKFNLRRKGDRVFAEYCKICSQARSLLKIDGKQVNYVKMTLDAHEGWPVEGFNREVARQEFSDALIKNYQELVA